MNKIGGNFFEEHIEKIVIAVIGLVCVWFLITRVIISPIAVGYDNKKFAPDEIDAYISQKAGRLESSLNRQPEPKPSYKPQLDDFIAMMESAVSDVNVAFYLPLPMISSGVSDKRVYDLPDIPAVVDIEAEHIRAVAYVPIVEINGENFANESAYEANDIDLVTVEAKFDVARLYKNFYESFAGGYVKEEWRDPCLAIPIFASVQLQRQELLADGSWSDWQVVPRVRIDHRKDMFEFVEKADGMPTAEVKVHLIQFNDARVRKDILQPDAYKIASSEEEWFPPLLHRKYQEHRRQMEAEEKRRAKAAEREERERQAQAERSSRVAQVRTTPAESESGGYGGDEYGGGTGAAVRRTAPPPRTRVDRRPERERVERERGREVPKPSPAADSVRGDFDKILITEQSDLAKMSEPLVLWAYDDTVEPARQYRYRVKLGVFNPIVGTNQISEKSKHLGGNAVFWSEFSDVSGSVEIPGKLYFFPSGLQEAAKTVTVKVSRYVLGYWYSKDFMVKPGEVIGKTIEYQPSEAEKDIKVPEKINYSTGAVLVDVIPVNDWDRSKSKNLRLRHYFDMLYSSDGIDIEHLPIGGIYWSNKLQAKFTEIEASQKKPKAPLRAWSGSPGEVGRRAPSIEIGEGGYEGEYEGGRR